jgi:hypothetical protein
VVSDNQQGLVDSVEDLGVAPLPNIPRNGRGNSRFTRGPEAAVEESVDVTADVEEVEGKGVPNFASFTAPKKEVVGIFIIRARGAGNRGCKVVPAIICGEAMLLSEPDEALAL